MSKNPPTMFPSLSNFAMLVSNSSSLVIEALILAPSFGILNEANLLKFVNSFIHVSAGNGLLAGC